MKKGLLWKETLPCITSSPLICCPMWPMIRTKGISGEKYIFMPYAQGIRSEEKEDVTLTPLLTSSEASYSKLNMNQAQNYEKEDRDAEGPFDVGYTSEKKLEEGTAGLTLFTSENLFTDNANSMVADANLTLFTNTVASMSDSKESVFSACEIL